MYSDKNINFICFVVVLSILLHLLLKLIDKWGPPSLSELTPIIFNMELIHLDSEASKYDNK